MSKNIEKVKKLIAGVGGQGTPRIGYTGKTIHYSLNFSLVTLRRIFSNNSLKL